MNIRPSILIENQGAFLFLYYDYPRGRVHAIPGGGKEPGESLTQTIEREILEELTLEISIGNLKWACEVKATEHLPETLHLVFSGGLKTQQTPRINPEHTSADGFVWLTPEQFKGHTFYPNLGFILEGEQDLLPEPKNLYLGVCPSRKWA